MEISSYWVIRVAAPLCADGDAFRGVVFGDIERREWTKNYNNVFWPRDVHV